MRALSKEEVQELPRGDVNLAGMNWLPDMSLALMLLLPDGRQARLLCTFAHNVRIGLEVKERSGGLPLTWDTTYSRLPRGGWHILMDFANTGSIELDCADLYLEYLA